MVLTVLQEDGEAATRLRVPDSPKAPKRAKPPEHSALQERHNTFYITCPVCRDCGNRSGEQHYRGTIAARVGAANHDREPRERM